MTRKKKTDIIIICGPTGIGKTSAAIKIAEEFKGEVISADSMQIYKYMDIGTAKPTLKEQMAVKHHMIDIVEPNQHFDAAKFADLSHDIILKLNKEGKLAVVAGGTGFYIKALVYGLFQSEKVFPGIKKRLQDEALICGAPFLHRRLKKIDPETAKKLHQNDTSRIIRAIELFEGTGKRISEQQRKHGFAEQRFRVLSIGLNMERAKLYSRINQRVDQMIDLGFIKEIRSLLSMGFTENLKPMQSIGYRHLFDFLQKNSPWEETIETFKRDTRRYAKRQLTWFNSDPKIKWLEPEHLEDMLELVEKFLKPARFS